MGEWRSPMSPAEVLASHVVLSVEQVAFVLGLVVSKGRRAGAPDGRQVLQLVARRKLRPVDAEQPAARWRFSTTMVRAYIDDPDLLVMDCIDRSVA